MIPVHNRPVAVRRAIDSVLAQTCQDFEVIVVDDGSTDGTAAAIEAIPDARVRLVRHHPNAGGSAARNIGIRTSRGEYVAFLDSDDEWLPPKLERQLEVFERARQRLGLVYAGVDRVYADGHVKTVVPSRCGDLARALLTANTVGETSVGIVPRGILEAVGGFDESLPSMQDVDLWLRICEQCPADFVPETLVRVMKSADSGRISANVARTLEGRELFCRKHASRMAEQRVLHLYLRESGWWQQRRARDRHRARTFYRQSIAAMPGAPLTYLLLLLACLPLPLLDGLARLKHGVAAALAAEGPVRRFVRGSFRPSSSAGPRHA